MSNFNKKNQDEEDVEETSPISSQDALLAVEKAGVDLKLISLAKILGVTQDSNEIQKRQLNSD
ncbi:81_t:CDS:2 [Entrophospora sp. SA101]|nr:81_t:CDS:2 [Entrophospora sp. SA101]